MPYHSKTQFARRRVEGSKNTQKDFFGIPQHVAMAIWGMRARERHTPSSAKFGLVFSAYVHTNNWPFGFVQS